MRQSRREIEADLQVQIENSIRKQVKSPAFLKIINTRDKGRGIATKVDLKKGQYVLYYHGQHLNEAPPAEVDDTYFMELPNGKKTVWIDATDEDGSFARLLNDNHKSPNLLCKIKKIHNKSYAVFLAARDIVRGEELDYNYGPGNYPWRKKGNLSSETTKHAAFMSKPPGEASSKDANAFTEQAKIMENREKDLDIDVMGKHSLDTHDHGSNQHGATGQWKGQKIKKPDSSKETEERSNRYEREKLEEQEENTKKDAKYGQKSKEEMCPLAKPHDSMQDGAKDSSEVKFSNQNSQEVIDNVLLYSSGGAEDKNDKLVEVGIMDARAPNFEKNGENVGVNQKLVDCNLDTEMYHVSQGKGGSTEESTETKSKTDQTNNPSMQTDPLCCINCSKTFKSRETFVLHSCEPGPKKNCFSCPECGKQFKIKGAFIKHIAFNHNHNANKTYTCSDGGKGFRATSTLVRHREFHIAKQLPSCEKCGKCFDTEVLLKEHIVTHADETKFLCDECWQFFDKAGLEQHMETHTGMATVYTCNECKKTFTTKQSLKNHLQNHRVKKIFSCPFCAKTFHFKSPFNLHVKRHTDMVEELRCQADGISVTETMDPLHVNSQMEIAEPNHKTVDPGNTDLSNLRWPVETAEVELGHMETTDLPLVPSHMPNAKPVCVTGDRDDAEWILGVANHTIESFQMPSNMGTEESLLQVDTADPLLKSCSNKDNQDPMEKDSVPNNTIGNNRNKSPAATKADVSLRADNTVENKNLQIHLTIQEPSDLTAVEIWGASETEMPAQNVESKKNHINTTDVVNPGMEENDSSTTEDMGTGDSNVIPGVENSTEPEMSAVISVSNCKTDWEPELHVETNKSREMPHEEEQIEETEEKKDSGILHSVSFQYSAEEYGNILSSDEEDEEEKKEITVDKPECTEKKQIPKFYEIDLKLHNFNKQMRKALNVENPDHQVAVRLLQRLEDLPIDANSSILLWKHPEVLCTIKKCAQYTKSGMVRVMATHIQSTWQKLILPADIIPQNVSRNIHQNSSDDYSGAEGSLQDEPTPSNGEEHENPDISKAINEENCSYSDGSLQDQVTPSINEECEPPETNDMEHYNYSDEESLQDQPVSGGDDDDDDDDDVDDDDDEWNPAETNEEENHSSEEEDEFPETADEGDCRSEEESCTDQPGSATCTSISVQTMKKQRKNKRVYDKRDYCFFCKKPQSRIARHLTTTHRKEQLVKPILARKKKSKERAHLLSLLRNKGNFIHNSKVIEDKSGTLVPCKRQKFAKAEEYLPCEHCFGLFSRASLWKHTKTCKEKLYSTQKRKGVQTASKMLLPLGEEATVELTNDVIRHMSADTITRIVQGDPDILSFGSNQYQNSGHLKHHHRVIAQRMRDLAKLLDACKVHDPGIKCMRDCIYPSKIDDVAEAARKVAGYDSKTKQYSKSASYAKNIGYSLKKIANVVKGKAIRSGDEQLQRRSKDFIELLEMDWHSQVTMPAFHSLKKGRLNRPTLLPLAEDIRKLTVYLRDHISEHRAALMQNPASLTDWFELCQALLVSVLMFNRRRSGELERLELVQYQKATSGNADNVPQEVWESLGDVEKSLVHQLKRVEMRGKYGRPVPVLLRQDTVNDINLLNSCREAVGVNSQNIYVFARPYFNAESELKSADCLRKFSVQCGATKPESLRSTKLRKHIATMSQILSLNHEELDLLASYMGHDVRIHREFYRLPESTLQLVKVSRLLKMMESGRIHEFKGKTLDEIDINMESDEEQDETEDEHGGPSISDAADIRTDNEEQVDETGKVTCVSASANISAVGLPSTSDSGTTSRQTGKTRLPTKSHRKCTVKKPWSTEEKDILTVYFAKEIKAGKLLKKSDCIECIEKYPQLASRRWDLIKDFIRAEAKRKQKACLNAFQN